MPRNASLDFFRGLAIFLVLFNHLEAATVPMLPKLTGVAGWVFWRLRNVGWTGVDMFFVLSGFLISGVLFKEWERTGGLDCGRFWVRRAFKILPSYWLLLGTLAVTGVTPWLVTDSVTGVVRSLVEHVFFLQNYLVHNPNGPTWSLAVEEHFYLLLPILFVWGILPGAGGVTGASVRRLRLVLVVILVAIPVLRLLKAGTGLGVGLEDFRRTHFRIDALCYGVLGQLMCRYHAGFLEPLRRRPGAALLCAAAFLACGLFLGRAHPVMFTVGYSLLSVGYSVVLLTMYLNGFGRWEGSLLVRGMALVGQWSYNIFLWNFFLWQLPLPFYQQAQGWVAAHSGGVAVLQVAGHFVVFSTFAILLGAVLTEWVEKPFLRLRDFLGSRGRTPVQEPLGVAPALGEGLGFGRR